MEFTVAPTHEQFEVEVSAAKQRVAAMDKVDGFDDRHLRTILQALECGIKTADTKPIYDAYVMLQSVAS